MGEAERSLVFGDDAETYDNSRPSYPDAVIDLLLQDTPTTSIDAGCGTGKAGRLVAARGVTVLGVEPDARMADVARRHGLDVHVSTFEDFTPTTPSDLVFSAQAWHWVDPHRGAATAAAALRGGGRWAAFWNRDLDPAIDAALFAAYERFAPHLVEERRVSATDDELLGDVSAGLAATRSFGALERHDVAWTDRLTVGDFVARCSTHSSHRLLEPGVAADLHAAIIDEFGAADDMLDVGYTTWVLTAIRQ